MIRGLLISVLLAVGSCRKVDGPTVTTRTLPSITTQSGATMVLIPAGEFRMGSGEGNSDEAQSVWEKAASLFRSIDATLDAAAVEEQLQGLRKATSTSIRSDGGGEVS